MTTSVAPHVSSAGSTPAQNALPSDIRNHVASSSAAATRITHVDMLDSMLSSTRGRKLRMSALRPMRNGLPLCN
jgi:hypothetical protein